MNAARVGRFRLAAIAALALACIAVGGFLFGRESNGLRLVESLSDASGSTAVLKIDGDAYGLDALAMRPGSRPRFVSFEQAMARVQLLIDSVLLSREAGRTGEATALSSAQVLQRLIAESGGPVAVSDDEVFEYYGRHRSQYVHPRKARLAYVRVIPRADLEAARRESESLYVQAQLDLGSSRPAFAASHQGAVRGEVLVPCSNEDGGALPVEVIRIGCALRRGSLSAPIETPDGLFLVHKTGELPARHVPLAQARAEIRALLESRALERAGESALLALRDRSQIVISRPALQSLVERPPQPLVAAPGEGPPRRPGADARMDGGTS